MSARVTVSYTTKQKLRKGLVHIGLNSSGTINKNKIYFVVYHNPDICFWFLKYSLKTAENGLSFCSNLFSSQDMTFIVVPGEGPVHGAFYI